MKVYISGPITGINNFEKPFQQAEDRLLLGGYSVVNPCTLPHLHGKSWIEYMREDIDAMIRLRCDAIALLKGWEKSRGALLELLIAESCGMTIIYGY